MFLSAALLNFKPAVFRQFAHQRVRLFPAPLTRTNNMRAASSSQPQYPVVGERVCQKGVEEERDELFYSSRIRGTGQCCTRRRHVSTFVFLRLHRPHRATGILHTSPGWTDATTQPCWLSTPMVDKLGARYTFLCRSR